MVGGPAMAADQAVKAPIFTKAPMIPVFSWTGFYFGGNAGGHWGQDNIATTTNVPNAGAAAAAALDSASPATIKPTGWLAGGQVGYNVQVSHVVLGFEGDADWVNGSASRSLVFPGPVPAAGDVLTDTTQSNFLGTLRPRLGAAFDHSLLYITGGLAVGTVNTTDSFAKFGGTTFEQASATATRIGWVAGGGFEYAFLDTRPWVVPRARVRAAKMVNGWVKRFVFSADDRGHPLGPEILRGARSGPARSQATAAERARERRG
jgi:outer membrane immunogenic protein